MFVKRWMGCTVLMRRMRWRSERRHVCVCGRWVAQDAAGGSNDCRALLLLTCARKDGSITFIERGVVYVKVPAEALGGYFSVVPQMLHMYPSCHAARR